MANMLIKKSHAQFQCSCCDKGGAVRRAGRKQARRREAAAWKREVVRGEA